MTKSNKVANNVFVLVHRDGSRKSKVHAMFDAKGAEQAKKFALTLKNEDGEFLKETTINSWFSQFRKVGTKVSTKAPAKKVVAKRVAKKTVKAPAKAA